MIGAQRPTPELDECGVTTVRNACSYSRAPTRTRAPSTRALPYTALTLLSESCQRLLMHSGSERDEEEAAEAA